MCMSVRTGGRVCVCVCVCVGERERERERERDCRCILFHVHASNFPRPEAQCDDHTPKRQKRERDGRNEPLATLRMQRKCKLYSSVAFGIKCNILVWWYSW